jgi:hypothetical protein
MQIIIQKKYIVLYEIAENIFAVFLVIVSFVFNINLKIKVATESVINFVKTFLFNLIKVNFNKIILKNNYKNNFVIYSNLLAPPIL